MRPHQPLAFSGMFTGSTTTLDLRPQIFETEMSEPSPGSQCLMNRHQFQDFSGLFGTNTGASRHPTALFYEPLGTVGTQAPQRIDPDSGGPWGGHDRIGLPSVVPVGFLLVVTSHGGSCIAHSNQLLSS